MRPHHTVAAQLVLRLLTKDRTDPLGLMLAMPPPDHHHDPPPPTRRALLQPPHLAVALECIEDSFSGQGDSQGRNTSRQQLGVTGNVGG
jgi:hypothetical protein